MTISQLQFINLVLWAITAVMLAPGTFRALFRRVEKGDMAKSAMFFTSVVFVSGNSRFLFVPENIGAWKIIYALSILLSIYIWVIVWNLRRDN